MKLHRIGVTAVVAVASLALAACGNDNPTGSDSSSDSGSGGGSLSGTLKGAGASSQESAMTAWIAGYQSVQPDVTVQYDSVGSGAGRENLISGAVDFAGSDAALDEDERESVKDTCGPDGAMNIPVYISPVAIPFNIEGVDELNLKPDTLAQIFDQKITNWNDPKIKADNPDADLPDLKITAVNRSDESGTTENFMEYLSAAAPDSWSYEVDKNWPVSGGEAAAQTTGVIEVVGSTNGAIGYADASAVGSLSSAKIGVGDEFVAFSPEAASKVVDASELSASDVDGDLALDLARDTTESGAYPIVLVSYHIVCHTYEDQETADLVKDFVGYVISEDGQQAAADAAGSAPISQDLRSKAEQSLELVKAGS
ncbi:phosphate ABC transporter substrate-binding protein PstS [Phycicoccus endophyticus]|uniref:Phosphate-binding protein n=1 Tax=Phycicoccus endophyticus TaxID=1690220 RepID=A0A7G9R1U5_9MICO|nr:phosphate ABC transporter substrate-binding protein PstS [Phycicoccus endophyticus]NHI18632.1 phosphate ABC transporter substrate-binding protein PstS [Phycicoccus endophyticus]QNN49570.1 phosphate ABC transporter substrate-binding protein PstS [Phycicoccus endophyticus]GGL37652.1 phosphate-binding protein PstS [Phycicoccus endophyticus]